MLRTLMQCCPLTLNVWLNDICLQKILSSDTDEEKSLASVSAVLFLVLALQTGLTGNVGDHETFTLNEILYLDHDIFFLYDYYIII